MSPKKLFEKWIRRLGPLAIAGLAGATACDEQDPSAVDDDKQVDKSSGGKADEWTAADAPTIFTPDLNLKLAELPLDGEAASIPWAASYWPVYEDSIAHK